MPTVDLNTELWALEPKYCINPRDLLLNVDRIEDSLASSYSINIKLQEQENTSMSQGLYAARQASVSVISDQDVTYLENFQDITRWCQETPKTPDMDAPISTDELNTPVFELDEFLFVPTISNDNSELIYDGLVNLNEQIENDISHSELDIDDLKIVMGSSQPSANGPNKTHSDIIIEDHIYNNKIENSDSIFQIASDISNSNSVKTELHTLYDSLGQQINQDNTNTSLNTVGYNIEDNLGMELEQSYIEIKSDDSLEVEVVDVKNCNVQDNLTSFKHDKPQLKLDFSNIRTNNTPVESIDTPEVIRTALSLHQGEFNLVNFVNDAEPIQEHSIQDSCSSIYDDISISASVTSSVPYNSDKSSDEDYELPTKRRKIQTGYRRISRKSTNSTKSDIKEETQLELEKPRRRGRPCKTSASVSSDDFRYRELRDKNNEASRKSRLNRKMKELQLEAEASDLVTRNQKLNAEVEHLSKLVDSMRKNLMQLLLKK